MITTTRPISDKYDFIGQFYKVLEYNGRFRQGTVYNLSTFAEDGTEIQATVAHGVKELAVYITRPKSIEGKILFKKLPYAMPRSYFDDNGEYGRGKAKEAMLELYTRCRE